LRRPAAQADYALLIRDRLSPIRAIREGFARLRPPVILPHFAVHYQAEQRRVRVQRLDCACFFVEHN
jgi:hypothetical protein